MGGSDDVRYLYERLVAYFPNIGADVMSDGTIERWRLVVQRAGRELDSQGLIKRERGIWSLTDAGERRITAENAEFSLTGINDLKMQEASALTHRELQEMLISIGQTLNFFALKEFEFYDVIWRANENSPRLSHVFEVQSKGNLDSALTKLKRAYETQRSNIFLVLTTERDARRAEASLRKEFHDLQNVLNVVTFEQIRAVHSSLNNISNILPKLLKI